MATPAPKGIVRIHGLAVGTLPQDRFKRRSALVKPVVFAALLPLACAALNKLSFVVVTMHLREGCARLARLAVWTQKSAILDIDLSSSTRKEKE